jgi:hypothetical protein
MLRFFTDFFNFAFLGITSTHGRVIDIDEANPEKNLSKRIVDIDEANLEQQEVKNQLVIRINWVLMAVCILSFTFTLIYPFLYPDKPVPDIIQNAFFTTLGWFGGVLGAFFQVEQNKSSS